MSTSETKDEPRWLTATMLMAIHAQQIERYGGAHGVLDENVVHSALARAKQCWAYEDDSDLADLAASYLVGFARSQGFNDGNKRTGLACALVFLSLNGQDLHVPPKELYALSMQAATDEADDQMVAAYLRARMTPRPQSASVGACLGAEPFTPEEEIKSKGEIDEPPRGRGNPPSRVAPAVALRES